MGGFAWVTLATNDSYSLGALVLAHSLKRVNTAHQLAIMITPGVSEAMRTQLSAVFNIVKVVDVLDSHDQENLALLARPELGITFTKLHCWKFTQFDKCVFLDADTIVLQNSDELFEREELSAAPDIGWPDCFNSGVFVFKPSEKTFKDLIDFALVHGTFDGGDQGLLNLYFSDWATKDIAKHLPFVYNVVSSAMYTYLPAFKQFQDRLKIIHFIGNSKPWLQPFDTETGLARVSADAQSQSSFIQLWWDLFCAHVHPSLTSNMAGLAGALSTVKLGAPRSDEENALQEHLRRQGWEQGNIDYMGRDSFDNIWKKISETLASGPSPPQPTALPSEPAPPLPPIQTTSQPTEVATAPPSAPVPSLPSPVTSHPEEPRKTEEIPSITPTQLVKSAEPETSPLSVPSATVSVQSSEIADSLPPSNLPESKSIETPAEESKAKPSDIPPIAQTEAPELLPEQTKPTESIVSASPTLDQKLSPLPKTESKPEAPQTVESPLIPEAVPPPSSPAPLSVETAPVPISSPTPPQQPLSKTTPKEDTTIPPPESAAQKPLSSQITDASQPEQTSPKPPQLSSSVITPPPSPEKSASPQLTQVPPTPATPTVISPTPPTSPPAVSEDPLSATSKLKVEPEVPQTPPVPIPQPTAQPLPTGDEPPVPPKRKGGKGSTSGAVTTGQGEPASKSQPQSKGGKGGKGKK